MASESTFSASLNSSSPTVVVEKNIKLWYQRLVILIVIYLTDSSTNQASTSAFSSPTSAPLPFTATLDAISADLSPTVPDIAYSNDSNGYSLATSTPSVPTNLHYMQTRSKSGIFKPMVWTATAPSLPAFVKDDIVC
ncbi:hypothetical protein RIF29_41420 [Crotalaria pallida]|uniref:Uncharacterized protein n=1 Tax=Crotalaria pallida TaxID=3830 RepID=A0AAN9E6D0_CROPI